jgi:PDZ domain-containing protein
MGAVPTSSRGKFFGALALVAAGVLVAAAWVPIPYYAVGPGPARDVTPLMRYDGMPRYEPTGRLVMTTVSSTHLTPLRALVAWVDPNEFVVREEVLYPPGTDQVVEEQRAISQMDQSKIDATAVVLRELLTYPKRHGDGALIEATVPGCPADGELFPGDVVTAIDGRAVASRAAASRVISHTAPGVDMRFTVSVDGHPEQATFARERCAKGAGPLVGVSMLDAFPIPVAIASGEIGGPSAGLMFALGLYELMTKGDLTQGRTIAGTGTIALDGTVGPIGGITDKVVGAERAGAQIFLVPSENMAELRGVDTGDMRLVSVATFDDALKALRAIGTGTSAG